MAERLSPKSSRRVTPRSVTTPDTRVRSASSTGMVIAVYGPRGGVGVTAVARSLAHAFQSREGADVALAELDPRAVRARTQAALRSLGTGVVAAPAASSESVPIPGLDAVIDRQADGVWMLTMTRPRTPAVGDAKAVGIALDVMRRRFPVSVAELEHQVNERTLAAFDAADRIVLVTEGGVASVRGTQRVLRLCHRLRYPDEKMCVVLNRVGLPGSLPAEDVSAVLKREIVWRIAEGHLTTTGLAERLLAE